MANNTEKTGWAKYCEEQNISITGKRIFIDADEIFISLAHRDSLLVGINDNLPRSEYICGMTISHQCGF